jgi:predicted ATPase
MGMGKVITSLTIKGFKSIRSLEDFKLGPLNILIGANGAGKSNFVSFFSLLSSLVNQELQLAVARRGGADAHLFLGPKITKEITARLCFGPNRYEFTLVPTSDNRLVFSSEYAYSSGDRGPSVQSLGTPGHAEAWLRHAGSEPRGAVPSYFYATPPSWNVYHFHDTSETAGVRRTGTTRDYESLRPDAGNLAAFLMHMREEDVQQ